MPDALDPRPVAVAAALRDHFGFTWIDAEAIAAIAIQAADKAARRDTALQDLADIDRDLLP